MGESPVKGFFRPSGAPCRTRLFPWLAPWATFSRPSGADADESYQQNVETPGTRWKARPRAGLPAPQILFLPALQQHLYRPYRGQVHFGGRPLHASDLLSLLGDEGGRRRLPLSLIHISEPTRLGMIS